MNLRPRHSRTRWSGPVSCPPILHDYQHWAHNLLINVLSVMCEIFIIRANAMRSFLQMETRADLIQRFLNVWEDRRLLVCIYSRISCSITYQRLFCLPMSTAHIWNQEDKRGTREIYIWRRRNRRGKRANRCQSGFRLVHVYQPDEHVMDEGMRSGGG